MLHEKIYRLVDRRLMNLGGKLKKLSGSDNDSESD